MALQLYFTSFFPKEFQGCEAAGTDIPYGYLETHDCTYSPCPRVRCACIGQEHGRLKLAFLIWVNKCCKESFKRSLLLRNHLGQKVELIITVISFFLLLLTGKHFCCSPFWVCWECLAWWVPALIPAAQHGQAAALPKLLYQAHRTHLCPKSLSKGNP